MGGGGNLLKEIFQGCSFTDDDLVFLVHGPGLAKDRYEEDDDKLTNWYAYKRKGGWILPLEVPRFVLLAIWSFIVVREILLELLRQGDQGVVPRDH